MDVGTIQETNIEETTNLKEYIFFMTGEMQESLEYIVPLLLFHFTY